MMMTIQEDTDAGIKRYMDSTGNNVGDSNNSDNIPEKDDELDPININDDNDIGVGIKNMVDSMNDNEKRETLKKLERAHLSTLGNKSKVARKNKNKNQKKSRRKNR